MKKLGYLLLILLILLMFSCATTKNPSQNGLLIPLWFSDPGTYVDEEDNIIFKSKERTKVIAERNIYEQSIYLSDYLEPTMLNEFVDSENYVYLLYSINRDDLTRSLNNKIDETMVDYNNYINVADSTSDVLEKYSLYINSQSILENISYIYELSEKEHLTLNRSYNTDKSLLQEKINLAKEQLVFSVSVSGDIDNLIKDAISNQLHELGYEESEFGLVFIDAVLNLKPAELDNDYINKYWNLTISLKDYNGATKESLNFKGRESKLDNEAVNQFISSIAVKKIEESLKTILP
ncbi:MAG: hypothetical protein OCD02_09140 [Spirochaetaceae bacterium]